MKFSKIIYKTALCATMAVSLSSCGGDWLDLQPSDSADADNAITSSADLRTAYVGMYAAFKGTSSFTDLLWTSNECLWRNQRRRCAI